MQKLFIIFILFALFVNGCIQPPIEEPQIIQQPSVPETGRQASVSDEVSQPNILLDLWESKDLTEKLHDIHPVSGEILLTIDSDKNPKAVASNFQGVWQINSTENKIVLFDKEGQREPALKLDSPSSSADGLAAVDDKEILFVLDSKNKKIFKLNSLNGEILKEIPLQKYGNELTDLAANDSALFLMDNSEKKVFYLDFEGNEFDSLNLDSKNNFQGLASCMNNLWASDLTQSVVVNYDISSKEIINLFINSRQPDSLGAYCISEDEKSKAKNEFLLYEGRPPSSTQPPPITRTAPPIKRIPNPFFPQPRPVPRAGGGIPAFQEFDLGDFRPGDGAPSEIEIPEIAQPPAPADGTASSGERQETIKCENDIEVRNSNRKECTVKYSCPGPLFNGIASQFVSSDLIQKMGGCMEGIGCNDSLTYVSICDDNDPKTYDFCKGGECWAVLSSAGFGGKPSFSSEDDAIPAPPVKGIKGDFPVPEPPVYYYFKKTYNNQLVLREVNEFYSNDSGNILESDIPIVYVSESEAENLSFELKAVDKSFENIVPEIKVFVEGKQVYSADLPSVTILKGESKLISLNDALKGIPSQHRVYSEDLPVWSYLILFSVEEAGFNQFIFFTNLNYDLFEAVLNQELNQS